MIKLKGTTLYPPAIFEILNQYQRVKDYVVEVFKNDLETDELKLHVWVMEEDQPAVEKDLKGHFQSRLRVIPELVFCDQATIESLQLSGGSRKINRFMDKR